MKIGVRVYQECNSDLGGRYRDVDIVQLRSVFASISHLPIWEGGKDLIVNLDLSDHFFSARIAFMFYISKELRLYIIFALFIAFMIGMNVLGGKIIPFGPFQVSVAFLIVPLSFLMTDIVEEVYGKKKAHEFVIAGVVALIVFLAFIVIFLLLPPAERFTQNVEYKAIFGTSARIVFASIVAFLMSQFHDVWSFNFWKVKTRGKLLWLRSNISTSISMVVDTFVFMFLAFYMLTPQFTAGFIIQMIIPYLFFKIIWGVLSTPLVYLGASWLRAGK